MAGKAGRVTDQAVQAHTGAAVRHPTDLSQGCDQSLAVAYDAALLDLDGVVYVGPNAVPNAGAALTEARRLGMRLAFVTNNASRPPKVIAAPLTEIGIPASADEVATSAQAA